MATKLYVILTLFSVLNLGGLVRCITPEDEGVKYADRCEVCKILATELQARLEETGKTSAVIETGYAIDAPRKKKTYAKSELRLLETLEGVCERILSYNIHKERTDSTRFAKGMSQTFQTLHGLVDKGVKVDLGIPFELWDTPSAEITNMKTQCEQLLEQNEAAIEEWYFNESTTKDGLMKYLCEDRALKGADSACLSEVFIAKQDDDNDEGKRQQKGDRGRINRDGGGGGGEKEQKKNRNYHKANKKDEL